MTDPVIIGNATRVYSLCEFPEMVPRYVGKTIQPLRLRMAAHLRTASREQRLPVHRWIAKRRRDGRQLCINLLETVPSDCDWAVRERFWIEQMRAQWAGLILNLTSGGEGLPGHRFSDLHKAKIAAALRTGAVCTCIRCGATFWRKRSEIARRHNKFCSRKCANLHNKGGHHA